MSTEDNVMQRIIERLPGLSPSHARVAEFILNNPSEATFMTATELARRANVSQATVIRFASELGLPGYPELQRELQQLLRARLTSMERFRKTMEEPGEVGHILHRVIKQDIENLERFFREFDLDRFDQVVEAISSADRVFTVATRAVGGLAVAMASYLSWVRPNVSALVYTPSTILDEVASTGPGDVVVAFSFPRYARITYEALALARDREATTVAITDSPTSPVASVARHILIAPTDAVSFVGSFAAPAALMQALVLAVALQDRQRTQSTMERLEQIWEKSQVYLKMSRVADTDSLLTDASV